MMTEAVERTNEHRNRQVDLEHEVTRAVARLKATVWALIMGLIMGVGLFAMTAILLIEAGGNADATTGFHLNLLGNYFPGFRVTWGGALIGFGYGFLVGALMGGSIGFVYNLIISVRRR